MAYEVMNRNDDTFHSEHGTLSAAVAAAKALPMAEVYLTDGDNVVRTVYEHGGRTCPGCGEFAPSREISGRQCEGCWEADRNDAEFYRANAADMYGW